MAEIEFQKISSSLKNSFKKYPYLWGGGALIVVGAGVYMFNRGSVSEVSTYLPSETISEGSSETSDVMLSDELSKMLEDILAGQKISQDNFASLITAIQNAANWYAGGSTGTGTEIGKTSNLPEPTYESFSIPQSPTYESFSIPQSPTELQKAAQLILATPSITFPEGAQYSTEQIFSMADWAKEENAAIASGATGTSKQTSDTTMIQTFHADGTVSFTPKTTEQIATQKVVQTEKRVINGATYTVPIGTRSDWKPGEAYKKSSSSSSSKSSSSSSSKSSSLASLAKSTESAANKAVSKVTGKTGSIEKQLSGMTSSQKLSTLKSAGLI